MRILFASPYCLLDTSSGAARSVMTQLEELARSGWDCRSLTLPVMDQPGRVEALAALRTQGLRKITNVKPTLWGTRRDGVEHVVVPCPESRRGEVSAQHEHLFFQFYRRQLKEWQPDIVLTYGGLLLENAIIAEARRRDVRTVFYLANAQYHDPLPFHEVDLVMTPSRALAELYRQRLGLKPLPIGSFTRLSEPLAMPRLPDRDRVTMVNPSPEKGAAYLLAIADACQKAAPTIRFQVVESRASKASVETRFGHLLRDLPNLEFVPHQPSLEQVLQRTRVLLFPSLWFEAAGRTLLEAQALGVPVLASSHGGNAEQLDGGGFLFDIAEVHRKDFTRVPARNEIAPWVERLKTLMSDDIAWQEASSRALEASARRDLSRCARVLSDTLTSICQRAESVKPPRTAAPAAP